MKTNIKIPNSVKRVLDILTRDNVHCVLAGGSVVDLLHNKIPNDYDIFIDMANVERLQILLGKTLKDKSSDYSSDYGVAGGKVRVYSLEYSEINIDLILIPKTGLSKREFVSNILNGFDLNICQIGFIDNVLCKSIEFEKLLSTKEIKFFDRVGVLRSFHNSSGTSVRFKKYLKRYTGIYK